MGIFLDEVVDETSNKSAYYIRDSSSATAGEAEIYGMIWSNDLQGSSISLSWQLLVIGSPAAKGEPEIESCELENREQAHHGTKGKTIKYQAILPAANMRRGLYKTLE